LPLTSRSHHHPAGPATGQVPSLSNGGDNRAYAKAYRCRRRVTLPGFSTFRREGIELSAAFTATVNAELTLGAVEETVTVTGGSPMVDVQNVRTQQTLTQQLLTAVPTSKSYVGVAALLVGATGGGGSYFSTSGDRDVGGNNHEGIFSNRSPTV
jgi:hypothetical protein